MGEPLPGGNMGGARRHADVVVRPGGPWTPTVQRLLAHLRSRGLDWVPAPVGIAADGSDLTTWLDGVVPTYPMPAWVWSTTNLITAARRLRELHDSTADFAVDHALWRSPSHEPAEVICHNDFAPYNFVYVDEEMTGVIDWDFASPGPRVWDLAYLAHRLVPLSHPDNPEVPESDLGERRARLSMLCASYGGIELGQVVTVVPQRLEDLASVTEEMARNGNLAVVGHAELYCADADWVRAKAAELI